MWKCASLHGKTLVPGHRFSKVRLLGGCSASSVPLSSEPYQETSSRTPKVKDNWEGDGGMPSPCHRFGTSGFLFKPTWKVDLRWSSSWRLVLRSHSIGFKVSRLMAQKNLSILWTVCGGRQNGCGFGLHFMAPSGL
jgi:hypothetical protein